MRILLLLICLLFISAGTSAQERPVKNVTHQQLVWFAYFNKLEISPKWYLVSEIQERRFINPGAQHQLVLRSHIHYRFVKDWDVSVGFTYFLQSPHNPESESELVVPELRPHIQIDGASKLSSRWRLDHRYRFESRHFRNFDPVEDELVHGYTHWFRARYRIGVTYKLIEFKSRMINLKASNEIHFNLGEEILYNRFDQNRYYFGASADITPHFLFELGYLNWFQQRASGNDFYDRDIFRFIIVHKLKLPQKNKVNHES